MANLFVHSVRVPKISFWFEYIGSDKVIHKTGKFLFFSWLKANLGEPGKEWCAYYGLNCIRFKSSEHADMFKKYLAS